MQSPDKSDGQIRVDPAQVIEAMPNGVIVIDGDFTILMMNAAFTTMTDISRKEAIGKKCHEVFPRDLCRTSACPMIRLREGLEPFCNEDDKCGARGRKASVVVTVGALQKADGSLAGIVRTVSDCASLYESRERFRKTMGGVIQAMSLTIEKRDRYTAGHQRRVTKLCRAIADELGFPWDRIQGLRMAAAVHDLGKILVPAAILNKPGDLSEHEMGIIRAHPQMAYDILKQIDFPWPLAEIVYQHHERLDGSGYPRGLKGDAILHEARILAVADVTEAMASFRPYRPALGIEAALVEIGRYKGVRFDPDVVDICTELFTVRGFDFLSKGWRSGKSESNRRDII